MEINIPSKTKDFLLKYLLRIFAIKTARLAIKEKLKIVDAIPVFRLNPVVIKTCIE